MNNSSTKRDHLPALDGIRGYGFLAVFLAHYFASPLTANRTNPFIFPLYLLAETTWLAVPAFFVLSGYLIGGILFNTRNREGFFRVFYSRRILRVFPLYYVTLLIVAAMDLSQGVHLNFNFWSQFLYIHNMLPGYTSALNSPPSNQIIHLWSLGIEEQFYMTWPIVVWMARDRKTLLRITAVLIAACWIIRFASPWIPISPARSYFATPTRADAILMGVAIALLADNQIFKRLQPLAKYVAVVGFILCMISISTHLEQPDTYLRVCLEFPLANITVAAMLMALLDPESSFARVCSVAWARWVGALSYGLYVIHFTYQAWFLWTFEPWLARFVPELLAHVLTAMIALGLTILLAALSFRFLESPAMNLRNLFRYGSVVQPPRRAIPSIASPSQGSALYRDGLQRRIGLRAAVTSSSRDTRVE